MGYLPGAINIPVDQLRQHMNELPKDKEIVIYCQVGLRGNVAYRQLVNNGFKARNLIGVTVLTSLLRLKVRVPRQNRNTESQKRWHMPSLFY